MRPDHLKISACVTAGNEEDKIAACLAEQQMPHGGWGMYPGASIDISASVKAYFALKLCGKSRIPTALVIDRQPSCPPRARSVHW